MTNKTEKAIVKGIEAENRVKVEEMRRDMITELTKFVPGSDEWLKKLAEIEVFNEVFYGPKETEVEVEETEEQQKKKVSFKETMKNKKSAVNEKYAKFLENELAKAQNRKSEVESAENEEEAENPEE